MAFTHALVPETEISLAPFLELQHILPSRVAAITPFVDQLMKFIAKFRGPEADDVDIEIAVREAIINAVIHGNQENPATSVHITCRCSMDGEVSITVRDEGPGFDVRTVGDPTRPENHLSLNGRGICLMRSFMDEVRFEEGGSVVSMLKNVRSS